MIWLIGYGLEKTFAYTAERLTALGVEHAIIDLDEVEAATSAHHRFGADGLTVTWNGVSRHLASTDVVYQRVYFRDLGSRTRNAYLCDFLDALSAYLSSIRSVNRPNASSENGLKLLHLARLSECGFEIPQTIAGNDDTRIAASVQPDGKWISKGCSGVRTRVTVVSKEDYGQLESIRDCPVQFQKRIPGDDVRVHFIGRRHVGLRMRTSAIDYRYAASDEWQLVEPATLPRPIEIKCLEYLTRANITFGGFDFRVQGDRWTVLECNAMPGYDYYDRKVAGAISKMLAELLVDWDRRAVERDDAIRIPEDSRACFITADRRPRTNHS